MNQLRRGRQARAVPSENDPCTLYRTDPNRSHHVQFNHDRHPIWCRTAGKKVPRTSHLQVWMSHHESEDVQVRPKRNDAKQPRKRKEKPTRLLIGGQTRGNPDCHLLQTAQPAHLLLWAIRFLPRLVYMIPKDLSPKVATNLPSEGHEQQPVPS